MKKSSLLFFPLFIFSFYLQSQTTVQLSENQRNLLAKANRHEKSGWTYLHIEGTPRERGFQHGYLMANEIKENLRLLSSRWYYETAMEWSWYVEQAGKILSPKVDSENLEEIDGIEEGLKVAGAIGLADP